MTRKLTEAEIEAGRSLAGGFTRAQLAEWGVPWPPPKGWKDALIAGTPLEKHIQPSAVRPSVDANELLRQVVMAVVEKGHASDLYEFSDVLVYFGAKPGARPTHYATSTHPDAPF